MNTFLKLSKAWASSLTHLIYIVIQELIMYFTSCFTSIIVYIKSPAEENAGWSVNVNIYLKKEAGISVLFCHIRQHVWTSYNYIESGSSAQDDKDGKPRLKTRCSCQSRKTVGSDSALVVGRSETQTSRN